MLHARATKETRGVAHEGDAALVLSGHVLEVLEGPPQPSVGASGAMARDANAMIAAAFRARCDSPLEPDHARPQRYTHVDAVSATQPLVEKRWRRLRGPKP